MPDVRTGDKVRVIYEGVVSSINTDGTWFTLNGTESAHATPSRGVHLDYASVEIVERAEPEYMPYSLYMDNDGDTFRRIPPNNDGHVWSDIDGPNTYWENFPTRPIDRLVRQPHE